MPEENPIKLTGLRGSDSFPFRAALGLVSVLQELPDWKGTKLGWDQGYAALQGPCFSKEKLIADLDAFYETRHQDPRWSWSVSGKTASHTGTRNQYLEAARTLKGSAFAWLRGTATDQVQRVTDKETRVAPSAWATYTGGGHLSILSNVSLGSQTKPSLFQYCSQLPSRAEALEKTLFGPWQCQDDIHALGWDYTQNSSSAQGGRSRAGDAYKTEAFAMALAVESLVRYPVHAQRGRVRTTGFSKNDRCFTFPLWQGYMTPRSITALLDHPLLHVEDFDRERIRQIGITHVFRGYILPDRNTTGKSRRVTLSRRVA